MVKGTDQEEGTPKTSINWVVSRRGLLKVYPDRLELGDWCIPFMNVEHAVVYSFPYLPFVRARVLEIQAGGKTYQFGFNPWADPVKHLPIRVEERNGKMRYSALSVVIRALLLFYILYLVLDIVV